MTTLTVRVNSPNLWLLHVKWSVEVTGVNINVGVKIKELRKAKNMTQGELARRVRVSASAVSSYEISAREPSYDVLIKVAALFNVTTDYLLGLNNKDMLDITHLSANQRHIIRETVLEFANSNIKNS